MILVPVKVFPFLLLLDTFFRIHRIKMTKTPNTEPIMVWWPLLPCRGLFRFDNFIFGCGGYDIEYSIYFRHRITSLRAHCLIFSRYFFLSTYFIIVLVPHFESFVSLSIVARFGVFLPKKKIYEKQNVQVTSNESQTRFNCSKF